MANNKKKIKLTPQEEGYLSDLSRKKRYSRQPKKLGSLLSRLMARRGYGQVAAMENLQTAWQEVAGRLAQGSRVLKLEKNRLEIGVKSSVVMQELQFNRRRYLKQLTTKHNLNIDDLHFRIVPH